MSRPMPEWCTDPGEISRLLRYLHSHDPLDVVDCIAIVEKPWHWDAEYQEMCLVQERPDLAKCDDLYGDDLSHDCRESS